MATSLTHRGITYAQPGTGTVTVNLDLQLQGGVDQDETEWQKGFGTTYPGGGVDEFSASNTDGSNRFNPRLIMLTLDNAMDEGETLTLSGQCSKIVSFVAQRADATANIGIVHTSDLVLTFDMEATNDGTTDDNTAMELWLVVV
tara:strand:+ start:11285 stop:11716 length:432 start_codon:yes stop_codon:yes gene_type:complete